MLYKAFLILMSQLVGRRKAHVIIDEESIFFELGNKENHFTFYTKVYSGDGYLPQAIRSCVSSSGVLRWQESGAYLKLDPLTHSVYLFQEAQMEMGKYLPFKHFLSDFCTVSQEWREMFREFAEHDSARS